MIEQTRPGHWPIPLTLFALVLAAALAVISWHGIERRALSFKDRPAARPLPAAASQEGANEKA
jgi:peptidoglycan/LPS O-acetylase OafA/YrhL